MLQGRVAAERRNRPGDDDERLGEDDGHHVRRVEPQRNERLLALADSASPHHLARDLNGDASRRNRDRHRAITTSAMTASTMRSLGNVRLRARKASMVSNVSGQIRSTIEEEMRRLAPLPIPRSVICSPSHITNTPPVVSVSTVVIRKKNPGLATD